MTIPKLLIKKLKECSDYYGNSDNILVDYFSAVVDGGCDVPSFSIIKFFVDLVDNNKTIKMDDGEYKIVENNDKRLMELFSMVFVEFIEKHGAKIASIIDDPSVKEIVKKIIESKKSESFMRMFAHSIAKYVKDDNNFEKVIDFIISLNDENIKNELIRLLNRIMLKVEKNKKIIIANKIYVFYTPEGYLINITYNHWFDILSDDLKIKLIKHINKLDGDELRYVIEDILKLPKIDDIYLKYIIKISNILIEKNLRLFMSSVLNELLSYNFDEKQYDNICEKVIKKLLNKLAKDNEYSLFELYGQNLMKHCKKLEYEWRKVFLMLVRNNKCEYAETIARKIFGMFGYELYYTTGDITENKCYKPFFDDILDI